MLGEWLGWGVAFCLLVGVFALKRSRTGGEPQALELLKRSDLMWCLLPLDDEAGHFHGASFVCSESFLAALGKQQVTWVDCMAAFGCTLDSAFQVGIRQLLREKVDAFEFETTIEEVPYTVKLSLVQSIQPSTEESKCGILLTMFSIEGSSESLQSKRQLQAENLGLRNILNALPVPLWVRNHEGKITYCNRTYAKLLETQPHKILSWQWELVDGESAPIAQSLYKAALANGTSQSLHVRKNLKGREIDFIITEAAAAAEGKDKAQVVGIAVDISEPLQEFHSLQEQLVVYADCLSQVEFPCCLLSPGAMLVAFSQAFADALELEGGKLEKGIHIQDILEMLRESGQLPEYIEFSVLKERCLRWLADPSQEFRGMWSFPSGKSFEVSAEVCGHGYILVSLKEMTQILALERRLQSIKSVWEFTIDNSHEALLVVGLDHRVQRVSQNLQEVLGFEIADIQSKAMKDILEVLSRRYNAPGGCQALEEALEMRKAHTLKLEEAGLTCSYMPLPDGRHLLRFVSEDKPQALNPTQNCLLFEVNSAHKKVAQNA